MENFLARFKPIIALSLHAQGTETGQNCTWTELSKAVYRLAEEEQRLPMPAGMTEQDLYICRSAVYTLVDEILLDSPRPDDPVPLLWYQYSLQDRYLGKDFGGEIFYSNLKMILHKLSEELNSKPEVTSGLQLVRDLPTQEPTISQLWQTWFANWKLHQLELTTEVSILSVYALCLAYGFKGQLHTQELELAELRKQASLMLLSLLPKPVPAEEVVMPKVYNWPAYELLIHILLPVSISIVWYFMCADIVARII